MHIIQIKPVDCKFCKNSLDINSQFILGDINKDIRVITDYNCPDCGFKPVGNDFVNFDYLNRNLILK